MDRLQSKSKNRVDIIKDCCRQFSFWCTFQILILMQYINFTVKLHVQYDCINMKKKEVKYSLFGVLRNYFYTFNTILRKYFIIVTYLIDLL